MPRLCCLLAALLASAAAAQTAAVPAFDLDRLSLNVGARETLTADTGDALEQGALRLSVAAQYQHTPLLLSLNGRVLGAYVSGRASVHVTGAYAVLPWLELGAQLPVVVAQGGDDFSSRGYAQVASAGLGAPSLQGRFALLQESRGQPVDLTAAAQVMLPVGSAEALAREPGTGLALVPRVGLGKQLGFLRVGAELGATVREAASLTPGSTDPADEVGSQLQGALAVSTTEGVFRGELSLRGTLPLTSAPPSLELLAGGRLLLVGGQIELLALAGPGIGKTPGTPAFRALVGLAWSPPPPAAPPPPPKGLELEDEPPAKR